MGGLFTDFSTFEDTEMSWCRAYATALYVGDEARFQEFMWPALEEMYATTGATLESKRLLTPLKFEDVKGSLSFISATSQKRSSASARAYRVSPYLLRADEAETGRQLLQASYGLVVNNDCDIDCLDKRWQNYVASSTPEDVVDKSVLTDDSGWPILVRKFEFVVEEKTAEQAANRTVALARLIGLQAPKDQKDPSIRAKVRFLIEYRLTFDPPRFNHSFTGEIQIGKRSTYDADQAFKPEQVSLSEVSGFWSQTMLRVLTRYQSELRSNANIVPVGSALRLAILNQAASIDRFEQICLAATGQR